MEKGILSMSISGTALNLGTLDIGAVSSASTVATITTDSFTGYTLSIGSVSGTVLTAVSDGAVTAGSEEYGMAVSGADAAFADDRGVSAGLALASANSAVTSREATLTFKAAIEELKAKKPAKTVVAVPVAPDDAAAEIEAEVDELVCLLREKYYLGAVGAYYEYFEQTEDDEVIDILSEFNDG